MIKVTEGKIYFGIFILSYYKVNNLNMKNCFKLNNTKYDKIFKEYSERFLNIILDFYIRNAIKRWNLFNR